MTLKFNKILTAIFAAIFAVSVALGIYLLMPKSTAFADDTFSHTAGDGHTDWTALTADLVNSEDGKTAGEIVGSTEEGETTNYYLTGNVTLTDNNITITGNVTLCLNGNMLAGTGSGSVITISDGEPAASLTLCDCVGDEENKDYAHNYYVDSDGLYVFAECATDCQEEDHEEHGTIYGGVITGGNNDGDGGGVYVNNDATFTMNGGTIAGNDADGGDGGGVYVNNDATFTMNSGTISNNTAIDGGGVNVNGTFTMNGGEISGNDGGVNVNDTFYMYGGTISGNTTNGVGTGVRTTSTFVLYDGYIYGSISSVENSTVSIMGGYIYGSISKEESSTITIYGGAFSEEAYSSILDDNNQPQYIADGYKAVETGDSTWIYAVVASSEVSHEHNGTNYDLLIPTGGMLEGGDEEESMVYYYLATDVTLTANLTISGYVTLCLNGNMLTGNGEGVVITVESGANFTLCDCVGDEENKDYAHNYYVDSDGLYVFAECATDCQEEDHEEHGTIYGGVITGGSNDGDGGGVYVNNDATFTMESGTIAGNYADWGGGVFVYDGTFTMEGGTITGNAATSVGGVYVEDATFTMNGGEIAYNTATVVGGVFVGYGTFTINGGEIAYNTATEYIGGVYLYESTFNMESGTISGNTATNDGGGVYVYGGMFTMTGGEISDNTADWGGGVFVYDGMFTMTGGEISDNTADWGGGVYVYDGTFTMEGGTITGNAATSVGGGVMVEYSTFTMNGGTISGNTAQLGGGVAVNESTFIMSGGTISGNVATEYGSGGVCVSNNATFTMYGGEISGNTTTGDSIENNGSVGGGVGVYESTFTLNGGYLDGSIDKYYSSGTITITGGALSQEAYSSVYDEDNEIDYIADGSTIINTTGDSTWAYVVVPAGYTSSTTEPTCTEEGYTAYTYTIDEREYTIKVNVVSATGHSFTDYISNNDATATEDGTKTATCDNGCGTTDTITDVGSATGTTDEEESGGLSGGAIAGIVIGCVVVAGAAVWLVIFLRRRKNA